MFEDMAQSSEVNQFWISKSLESVNLFSAEATRLSEILLTKREDTLKAIDSAFNCLRSEFRNELEEIISEKIKVVLRMQCQLCDINRKLKSLIKESNLCSSSQRLALKMEIDDYMKKIKHEILPLSILEFFAAKKTDLGYLRTSYAPPQDFNFDISFGYGVMTMRIKSFHPWDPMLINSFSVSVITSKGKIIPVDLVDQQNGSYRGSFPINHCCGLYCINVRLYGYCIQGCPRWVEVCRKETSHEHIGSWHDDHIVCNGCVQRLLISDMYHDYFHSSEVKCLTLMPEKDLSTLIPCEYFGDIDNSKMCRHRDSHDYLNYRREAATFTDLCPQLLTCEKHQSLDSTDALNELQTKCVILEPFAIGSESGIQSASKIYHSSEMLSPCFQHSQEDHSQLCEDSSSQFRTVDSATDSDDIKIETSIKSVKDKGNNGIPVKRYVGKIISAVGKNTVSLRYPIGVTRSNNNVIICDTGNDRVVILDAEGRMKSELRSVVNNRNIFKRPSAVVALPESMFAVKDDNQIHVFSEDGYCIRKIGLSSMEKPYGLVVDDQHRLITLNLTSKPEILIFSIDGRLMNRSIFQPLWKKHSLKSKCRFMGLYCHEIMVSDLGLCKIYKTDLDGNMLLNFGRTGSNSGMFFEPSGITVDQDGLVFIGDSRNDRIQAFTWDGQFSGVVELDQPIRRPSDIHLTEDGQLLTLNYLDHTLLTFKLTVCEY